MSRSSKKLALYCDGASRGNPGPGAYGFVVLEGKTTVFEAGGALGVVTNNVAEYQALIFGLRKCLELGATEIQVRSDSELLIRQLNGEYQVKAAQLLPLVDQAKKLLSQFSVSSLSHLRREENARADELANLALDTVPK